MLTDFTNNDSIRLGLISSLGYLNPISARVNEVPVWLRISVYWRYIYCFVRILCDR